LLQLELREVPTGRALELLLLLPEVPMLRDACAKVKSEGGSILLHRPITYKHLPQYGSRNTLRAFDKVIRSQLRYAL
jgi:hypothetical protein